MILDLQTGGCRASCEAQPFGCLISQGILTSVRDSLAEFISSSFPFTHCMYRTGVLRFIEGAVSTKAPQGQCRGLPPALDSSIALLSAIRPHIWKQHDLIYERAFGNMAPITLMTANALFPHDRFDGN